MDLTIPAKDVYGTYNDGLNPLLFAALEFQETISQHFDERIYSAEVIFFLEKEGKIVESKSFAKYIDFYKDEDKQAAILKKKMEKENNGGYMPYSEDNQTCRLFRYKNYLVQQNCEEGGNTKLIWYYPASQKLDTSEFEKYVIPEDKEAAKVGILLKNSQGGMMIKKVSFESPEIDLNVNYGQNFGETHDKILDKLENFDKGIVILKGSPGTGKSFYIKWLTMQVPSRQFIFIPVGMCGMLAEPDMLTLLMSYGKNSVLIIEDAEQAIQSRDENLGTAGVVSTLLQLSDGILSNLLSITIILTWNTEKEKIDPALMRAGRTLFTFTFGKLSIEDGQKVVNKLNKNIKVNKEMTLAEIYNIEVDNNYKPEISRKMGFGA